MLPAKQLALPIVGQKRLCERGFGYDFARRSRARARACVCGKTTAAAAAAAVAQAAFAASVAGRPGPLLLLLLPCTCTCVQSSYSRRRRVCQLSAVRTSVFFFLLFKNASACATADQRPRLQLWPYGVVIFFFPRFIIIILGCCRARVLPGRTRRRVFNGEKNKNDRYYWRPYIVILYTSYYNGSSLTAC